MLRELMHVRGQWGLQLEAYVPFTVALPGHQRWFGDRDLQLRLEAKDIAKILRCSVVGKPCLGYLEGHHIDAYMRTIIPDPMLYAAMLRAEDQQARRARCRIS